MAKNIPWERTEIPVQTLETPTLLVSLGLANFEQSGYATRTCNDVYKYLASLPGCKGNARKGISRGMIDPDSENYDVTARKLFSSLSRRTILNCARTEMLS